MLTDLFPLSPRKTLLLPHIAIWAAIGLWLVVGMVLWMLSHFEKKRKEHERTPYQLAGSSDSDSL